MEIIVPITFFSECSTIPGSIPGVGTNIYLELIWVRCALAIVTAMTSICGHKSMKNNYNIRNGRCFIETHRFG
jgi:hypothetical protein